MARIRLDRIQVRLTAQRLAMPLVERTSNQILRAARVMAPVGDGFSGSGKVNTDLPLHRSLHKDTRIRATSIITLVGSKADYAATVHQGSAAHVIRGRGKMLKFRWDRGDFLVAARAGRRRGNRRTGQFHYFLQVRHPGNKRPVRYLTTPLAMFGRVNGFIVTSNPVSRTRLP